LFLTSRSAILEYQRCPRSRYWRYHHGGTGITPTRRAIPLVVGGSVHLGLEGLLKGASVEDAVNGALQSYSEEVEGRGFNLSELEDSGYVYQEQRALCEALIRVFAIHGLAELHQRYRVLSVEREINWEIAPGLTLMARCDGELEDRELEEPFILSFKTAAYYDRRKERDGGHDVQGLSEMAAFEADTGRRAMGVQMVYLIKGTRTETYDGSGIFAQASHLIRPWMKEGAIRPEFAWKWKFQDVEGGWHTLGKSWKRVPIWERMPIKEWIEILSSGSIQPEAGDALSAGIIFPPPIYRREQEMKDWVEQIVEQEGHVREGIAYVEQCERDPSYATGRRGMLNAYFPQYRRSCDYPTACDFQAVCFGPAGDDPVGTGLYQIRKPHHELEVKALESRSNNHQS
jgi:hypothetical protein